MIEQIYSENQSNISLTDEQNIAELVQNFTIQQLEENCLQEEQLECPVMNIFGPNLYIRSVHIPAGTFAIGHKQRDYHMNIFLQGRMVVFSDEKEPKTIEAPMVFTAPPGKKVGYAIEDVIWLNVYATNETDVSVLEEMFMEKSEEWSQTQDRKKENEQYQNLLDKLNVSDSLVQEQSENIADQIQMPYGSYKICIHKSPISGRGVFATSNIAKGEIIGSVKLGNYRTPIGRYLNHSDNPNARVEVFGKDLHLIALQGIEGYKGGSLGDEITTDYEHNLKKSQEALLCQV